MGGSSLLEGLFVHSWRGARRAPVARAATHFPAMVFEAVSIHRVRAIRRHAARCALEDELRALRAEVAWWREHTAMWYGASSWQGTYRTGCEDEKSGVYQEKKNGVHEKGGMSEKSDDNDDDEGGVNKKIAKDSVAAAMKDMK